MDAPPLVALVADAAGTEAVALELETTVALPVHDKMALAAWVDRVAREAGAAAGAFLRVQRDAAARLYLMVRRRGAGRRVCTGMAVVRRGAVFVWDESDEGRPREVQDALTLQELAVLPHCRRRGEGTALLASVLRAEGLASAAEVAYAVPLDAGAHAFLRRAFGLRRTVAPFSRGLVLFEGFAGGGARPADPLPRGMRGLPPPSPPRQRRPPLPRPLDEWDGIALHREGDDDDGDDEREAAAPLPVHRLHTKARRAQEAGAFEAREAVAIDARISDLRRRIAAMRLRAAEEDARAPRPSRAAQEALGYRRAHVLWHKAQEHRRVAAGAPPHPGRDRRRDREAALASVQELRKERRRHAERNKSSRIIF